MNTNPRVSVIIPVYNVEAYLCKCLDSVANQTYRDFEVIVIDDGSPDGCGAICDEYARQDLRFRILHKKNAGLSAAWNDGMKMATGEWITFVDSDDWIDPAFFESMLKDQHVNQADIIQSNGYFWEDDKGQVVRKAYYEPFLFENGEGKEFLITHTIMRPMEKGIKANVCNVWGKLYRTSFLKDNHLEFDTQIRAGLANDALFNINAFQRATAVSGATCCGYHYRVTGGSGTFKYDPERAKKEKYVLEQIYHALNLPDTTPLLKYAFESFCLRDIVHNLERCYFHPMNRDSRQKIADGIGEMKQITYYRQAIDSKKNPYNGVGLIVFQAILRMPWVWPLRAIIHAWRIVDR